MLQIKEISKTFNPGTVNEKKALRSLSLTLADGDFVTVIGGNGAGKSTLIKLLTGAYKPDEGEMLLDGQPLKVNGPKDAMNMGLTAIYQELNVIPKLTVWENIFLGRELRNKKGLLDIPQMKERAKELLQQVRQNIDVDEKVENLGMGHQQMVEICKALVLESRLIIMDEPTVAVDPQSRNKILEGIKKLNEQGSTIIYTSHYMEEVEQICTRIAIMDHGHVIASGTREELKKMIKTGETITIEAIPLTEKNLEEIQTLPHVFDLHYEDQVLTVRCTGARHNLIQLLNYLQSQDITFGQVSSELPTLNDVFLEITGKQLRD